MECRSKTLHFTRQLLSQKVKEQHTFNDTRATSILEDNSIKPREEVVQNLNTSVNKLLAMNTTPSREALLHRPSRAKNKWARL